MRAGVRETIVSDGLFGVRPTRPARDSRAATSQRGLLKKPLFVETQLWVPLFTYVSSNQ